MEIEYCLTKQDYIDFNVFHLGYSKTIKRSLFINRYIVSIIFLIIPFVFSKITKVPFKFWLFECLIIYVLWVLFYPKYTKWNIKRKISKELDEDKNINKAGISKLTLTDDGIIAIDKLGESKMSYEAIIDIVEEINHIFIYVGANKAYIVPTRSFKNTNQKEKFIYTLSYMKNKKDIKI
ncbi:YcxB family protein [Clostridium thailandense]|uniref:YcxB family protein n=1 Tax=Clostridium thailandense TaxID=2794346 RepID=UPI003989E681